MLCVLENVFEFLLPDPSGDGGGHFDLDSVRVISGDVLEQFVEGDLNDVVGEDVHLIAIGGDPVGGRVLPDLVSLLDCGVKKEVLNMCW